MFNLIRNWYCGKQVEKYNEEPKNYGGIKVIPEYSVEFHWSAKGVRLIVNFYLRHWQWVWGAMFSSIGAYFGFLKAFSGC